MSNGADWGDLIPKIFVISGILLILYGALLIGSSKGMIPHSVLIPVPWSEKPVTIDNPQIEPGAVMIILGLIVAYVGYKMGKE